MDKIHISLKLEEYQSLTLLTKWKFDRQSSKSRNILKFIGENMM